MEPLPAACFGSMETADPASIAAWKEQGMAAIAEGKVRHGVLLLEWNRILSDVYVDVRFTSHARYVNATTFTRHANLWFRRQQRPARCHSSCRRSRHASWKFRAEGMLRYRTAQSQVVVPATRRADFAVATTCQVEGRYVVRTPASVCVLEIHSFMLYI